MPQQPLCKHPPNWLVCSMCALCLWNRSKSLSVCFFLNYFLLTRLCCRSHCRVFIPEQHLPRAILASPTKKANKKDIYTHRDYFSVRATVQPQGGSIHSPTRHVHGTRPAKTCSQRICETELLPYKINTRRSTSKLCSERHVYV